jgi:hypothetical protein
MFRLVLAVVVTLPAVARGGAYGPFDTSENRAVTLEHCRSASDIRQDHPPLGDVDFSRAGSDARLRVTMAGIEHYEAQVFSAAAPVSARVNVNVQAMMPFDVTVDQALCDDLNRDGVMDFVVPLWNHGNGFGAGYYDWLIALSADATYRFWTINARGALFARLSPDGPIGLATEQFAQKKKDDGEQASYFVWDLWSFSGGNVVNANAMDRRFPKWIRFTLKPNDLPAKSLTDDDKKALYRGVTPVEAVPP